MELPSELGSNSIKTHELDYLDGLFLSEDYMEGICRFMCTSDLVTLMSTCHALRAEGSLRRAMYDEVCCQMGVTQSEPSSLSVSKRAATAAHVAAAVRLNPALRSVDCLGIRIDAHGMVLLGGALAKSSVSRLFLYANRLGDAGAVALAETLKVNGSLETLLLDCNEVGAPGSTALASVLRINDSLKCLKISQNCIAVDLVRSIRGRTQAMGPPCRAVDTLLNTQPTATATCVDSLRALDSGGVGLSCSPSAGKPLVSVMSVAPVVPMVPG